MKIAKSTQPGFYNRFTITRFVVFWIIVVLMVSNQSQRAVFSDTYIPTPHGSTIISVRLPTNDGPIREFSVDASGTMTGGDLAGLYGQAGDGFRSKRVLSPVELGNVTTFITEICTGVYQLPNTTTESPIYNIGIRCPGGIREVRVPAAEVPAIIPRLAAVFAQPR